MAIQQYCYFSFIIKHFYIQFIAMVIMEMAFLFYNNRQKNLNLGMCG